MWRGDGTGGDGLSVNMGRILGGEERVVVDLGVLFGVLVYLFSLVE